MCEKSVIEFCDTYDIRSCKVLLAVSGGCDSVALLHLFTGLKKQLALKRIAVAHVNHGLRPGESAREAAFVSRLAKQAGCRFHLKKITGKRINDPGVEEWARAQRYDFFLEIKRTFGYAYVATAHTADDQAETVLMRLARGSGLAGLCGIIPKREDGVIRPLINLWRKELEAWLKERGKSWHQDASNADQRFKRNFIRHTIIPALTEREPDAAAHLAEFAEQMLAVGTFLSPFIDAWLKDHVLAETPERFVVRKPGADEDTFLVSESVAQLFRNHAVPFDRRSIAGFLDSLRRNDGCFLLKGGWKYFPDQESVEIVSGAVPDIDDVQSISCRLSVPGETRWHESGCCFITAVFTRGERDLKFDSSNWTIFLDAEKAGNELLARSIRKDDVFRPLGLPQTVTAVNYLKSKGMSYYYRRRAIVLTNKKGEILWLPGVAINHRYRITKSSKKIYSICCRRNA